VSKKRKKIFILFYFIGVLLAQNKKNIDDYQITKALRRMSKKRKKIFILFYFIGVLLAQNKINIEDF